MTTRPPGKPTDSLHQAAWWTLLVFVGFPLAFVRPVECQRWKSGRTIRPLATRSPTVRIAIAVGALVPVLLAEHEASLKTKELCRKHGISDAIYKWKVKSGGAPVTH
jgi:hypothetical protein